MHKHLISVLESSVKSRVQEAADRIPDLPSPVELRDAVLIKAERRLRKLRRGDGEEQRLIDKVSVLELSSVL